MSFKRPPKIQKIDPFPRVSHDNAVEGVPQQTNVDIVKEVRNCTTDPRIQQGMAYALAQMQKDGCTGNFRLVESQFGNFLIPVIPTRTDLGQ